MRRAKECLPNFSSSLVTQTMFAHWKALVPSYHYFRSLISIELFTSRARYFRVA